MKNVALITGASGGIGMEFAKIHAEKGGDLVLVARSSDKLEALRKELESKHGVNCQVLVMDLSLDDSAKEVHAFTSDKNIDVEILINNAGFGGLGKFHERKLEDDLKMIQLNIKALTALTHYYLNDFVAKNSGRILNVSSTASLMPGPLQAVYYATKAYVSSFTNALSEELRDTNVSVTNLMPGATETGFAKESGMDKTVLFDKTASARSVALAGYDGMLKGKLDITAGLTLMQKLMLGSLPLTPKKIVLGQIYKLQQVK